MLKTIGDRPRPAALLAGLGRALALLAVVLTFSAPIPAAAETYDECFRRECANNPGSVMCGSVCNLRNFGGSSSMPAAPTLFGAIALDDGSLIPGIAKDYGSRADAERRALAMCRRAGGSAGGCKVVVWARNSCLALSTSEGDAAHKGAWGYAYLDDGSVSRRDAAAACRKNGGTACRIVASFCTG